MTRPSKREAERAADRAVGETPSGGGVDVPPGVTEVIQDLLTLRFGEWKPADGSHPSPGGRAGLMLIGIEWSTSWLDAALSELERREGPVDPITPAGLDVEALERANGTGWNEREEIDVDNEERERAIELIRQYARERTREQERANDNGSENENRE